MSECLQKVIALSPKGNPKFTVQGYGLPVNNSDIIKIHSTRQKASISRLEFENGITQTLIPVVEITDNCRLKTHQVYGIPGNKLLDIKDHSTILRIENTKLRP